MNSHAQKILTLSLSAAVSAIALTSMSGCSGRLNDLTTYTAATLCSKALVTGQSQDTIVKEDLLLITDGAADLATLTLDEENKTATSQALTSTSTAIYREGVGCTLVGAAGEEALRAQIIPPVNTQPLPDSVPWPMGNQGAVENSQFDYDEFKPHADFHFTEQGDYQIKSSSLAIAYQGELIFEKYAEGFDGTTPIYGYSLGKTVAALFSGVLVGDNVLDINTPASLPEWQDDERATITPHHLLTMTSGLEWQEIFDDTSSDLGAVYREEDLGSFAANKPLLTTPGTAFNYSSGSTMVLSKVIKNLLGGELSGSYQALQNSLFAKVGLNNTVVQADASGSLGLGAKVMISSHDLARIGQFILQQGAWGGEQILPQDWVAYMSTPVGLKTNLGFDYGAGVWLNTALNGDAFFPALPEDTLIAYGLRGQFIVVVPSMELVIIRTGNTMDMNALQFIPEMNQLIEQILAALPA